MIGRTGHRLDLRSWSGTEQVTARGRVAPGSEDEVAAVLAGAGADGLRVKPAGAMHSFNGVALTDGISLSLDNMRRVLVVDSEGGKVRVQAGMRLHELMDALHGVGLALPVRGSVAEQSLAGAISTGTHGSAPGQGNLASLVTGLTLVTADGSVNRLSADQRPDLFDAARVGLGALGVITELTVSVVPSFRLTETVEARPFDEVVGEIDWLRAGCEFVKVWWIPPSERLLVFRYERTDAGPTTSALGEWIDAQVVNRLVLPAVTRGLRAYPAGMRTVAQVFEATYFRRPPVTDQSHRVLGLVMPPRHREQAWALPVEDAATALREVRAVTEREGLWLDMNQEFRFVARDSAWLSPMVDRDSVVVGALAFRAADTDRYFTALEARMLDMGGRPHWGKEFAAGRDRLATLYPRFDDFVALRDRLDPGRLFANPFLDRVLGP